MIDDYRDRPAIGFHCKKNLLGYCRSVRMWRRCSRESHKRCLCYYVDKPEDYPMLPNIPYTEIERESARELAMTLPARTW